jgi:hypothetical protein
MGELKEFLISGGWWLLVCVGAKKPGCRSGYLDVCRVTLDKTINNIIKIQKDEIQMVCSYIRKKKEKNR